MNIPLQEQNPFSGSVYLLFTLYCIQIPLQENFNDVLPIISMRLIFVHHSASCGSGGYSFHPYNSHKNMLYTRLICSYSLLYSFMIKNSPNTKKNTDIPIVNIIVDPSDMVDAT